MNIADILTELNRLPRTSFGVSVPDLRQLARKIARQDYMILQNETLLETFELRLLHAFVLGYARDTLPNLLQHFAQFIPYVNDWAICDSLCQNFTIARIYPQQVWDFLIPYSRAQQEFEIRIVAIMLLSHYLNDEYLDLVLRVLDSLKAEKYYAQMGVAWALATICAKYPAQCLLYLQSPNNLNHTTFRMAVRKICESFRVSEIIKQKVKNLKHLNTVSE